MKILVLGGNGFIGSHLVDELYKLGASIRVFDCTGDNFQRLRSDIDYRIGNISDTSSVGEALRNIDVVYHLVSTSLPGTSNLDPSADVKGNLISTLRLLEQMIKLNVKKIVYLSSGGTVYGNPKQEPVPENHPLQPICSYGIVKVAIENYLFMFQQLHGLEPVILRPSNIFGPRQGHIGVQGIVPTFFKQVVERKPIRIWGDGSVVRDYVYISDFIDLCVRAGYSKVTGVFNAGKGEGCSLNEMVILIEEDYRYRG